jgi:hypothetical protein
MDSEFSMSEAIVNRLGQQIADLVVQLAIRDARIEQLQAQAQVQTAQGPSSATVGSGD